jgi:hypothetical protein
MSSRSRLAAVIAIGTLASGFATVTNAPIAQAQSRQVSIAVPAYFDDDALWAKSVATPQVSHIIGHPDTPKDGKYVPEAKLAGHLNDAKKAGKIALVYVTAGYDKVTWQSLGDSIESALAAFPQADGVFLDEIGYNQCDKFTSLFKGAGNIKGIKARINNKLVVQNPGAPIYNCFETLGDAFLNLERENGKVGEWVANVKEPGNVPFYSWMFKSENRPRIWQMIHDVPAPKMADAVDDALKRNASVLFLTNDRLPNPYDTLPDDDAWKALLDRVDFYNSGKALPTVMSITVPTTAAPATTKAPIKKTTVVKKKTTVKKTVKKK